MQHAPCQTRELMRAPAAQAERRQGGRGTLQQVGPGSRALAALPPCLEVLLVPPAASSVLHPLQAERVVQQGLVGLARWGRLMGITRGELCAAGAAPADRVRQCQAPFSAPRSSLQLPSCPSPPPLVPPC